MSVVEVALEIDAPPEDVWDVVADPTNLPRWNRHVVSVEGVPENGLREGSRYTTHVSFMGVRAKSEANVIHLRPPEYAKVRLSGLVEGTVETWLERRDRQRTRLRHRIDYRFKGGSLGSFAARAVSMMGAGRLLRRGAESQKAQAEGR
ncbi:MAG TPA: SRPBCC family protein [Actinomycetota bacterium]|nr:SRPBCC family protein [Actinomycetota bacterium]